MSKNVATNARSRPVFIDEDHVKRLLDWNQARYAVEAAFVAVSNQARDAATRSDDHPVSSQPARTFVQADGGVLLCMPAYVGRHSLVAGSSDRFSTLACKLITSFRGNAAVGLPSINGEVFLFNNTTGKLDAIVEANYLTGIRTAAASLVATDHLYLRRRSDRAIQLGIVGCGFQGTMHAIGFVRTQPLASIRSVRLWNRTPARAHQLKAILEEEAKKGTESRGFSVIVCGTVEDCCRECDVLVTATGSGEPLVYRRFLKPTVHINAIGAGEYHHAELAQDVYDECRLYIDHWDGARKELANLRSTIVGEVGEVILRGDADTSLLPSGSGISVFQSLGMATEDVTVGRLVYEKYLQEAGTQ